MSKRALEKLAIWGFTASVGGVNLLAWWTLGWEIALKASPPEVGLAYLIAMFGLLLTIGLVSLGRWSVNFVCVSEKT